MTADTLADALPAYRAKLMHPDGVIETTVAIMASTLPEAEDQVRGLSSTYDVEIWESGQMVSHLPFHPLK